jgi:hypothetical protein
MMFPNQDVPLKDRGLNWVKLHLDYADSILNRRNSIYGIMDRLYNSYNGVKNADALRFIEKTYGRANKSKYISYRLGRNKLMLLQGEWLNTPLRPTVTTINVEARVKKLDEADTMRGALASREELAKLKEAGVDVLEGMELPEGDPDEVFNSMSFKDKNEHVMQVILDNGITELDMKFKLAKNLLDLEIVSGCYGKIEMDEDGNVDYLKIDPRDAIFDEIEGDDFIERSPLKGARYRMTVSEVNRKYKLTKEQRQMIKDMEGQINSTSAGSRKPRMYQINGDMCVDVIHIEWISAIPTYYKLSPKTKAQLEIDESVPYYRIQMDAKEYEENKEAYDKMVEKGKLMGIQTEWAEDIREAVRIAGVIDLDLGRKKFQPRRVDTPNKVIDMSYVGYLFNTVDGMRISLQQVVENFDAAFDVVMYQILKELNTAKGKVLGLNRAGLPQGRTTKEIMYDVLNDGFIDFDSSADGNESGRDMRLDDLINVYDLGVSSSFQQLIMLKNDIRMTLDLITGINENRQGDIAASSTAMNTQVAITASKNITTPLMYGMSKYVERVCMKMCEYYKLSYAFYKVEKGRQILGDMQQKYLEVQKEIGYQDYGVSIQDGGRYVEAKNRLMQLAEASLNAKEIRLEDIMAMDATESFAEAKSILKSARKSILKVAQDQQARQIEADQQMQAQQLQAQQQMMLENREDMQASKISEIQEKTKGQIMIDDNKMGKQMAIDTNNIQQKGIVDGTMDIMSSPQSIPPIG